ncbi:hypothetical protein [Blastomonas sp.]|uniref:hypothetical protein n=1 Tax=Blastomonas sp. TaxID=1909299 RepID=UPI00406A596C
MDEAIEECVVVMCRSQRGSFVLILQMVEKIASRIASDSQAFVVAASFESFSSDYALPSKRGSDPNYNIPPRYTSRHLTVVLPGRSTPSKLPIAVVGFIFAQIDCLHNHTFGTIIPRRAEAGSREGFPAG